MDIKQVYIPIVKVTFEYFADATMLEANKIKIVSAGVSFPSVKVLVRKVSFMIFLNIMVDLLFIAIRKQNLNMLFGELLSSIPLLIKP